MIRERWNCTNVGPSVGLRQKKEAGTLESHQRAAVAVEFINFSRTHWACIGPSLGYSTYEPALLRPTNFKKKKNRRFLSTIYIVSLVGRSTRKICIHHLITAALLGRVPISPHQQPSGSFFLIGARSYDAHYRVSRRWRSSVDGKKHREKKILGQPRVLTNGIIISSRIHMIDKQLPMQITRFINIGREPCYDSPDHSRATTPFIAASGSRKDSHFIWLTGVARESFGQIRTTASSVVDTIRERKLESPATIFFLLLLSPSITYAH